MMFFLPFTILIEINIYSENFDTTALQTSSLLALPFPQIIFLRVFKGVMLVEGFGVWLGVV